LTFIFHRINQQKKYIQKLSQIEMVRAQQKVYFFEMF